MTTVVSGRSVKCNAIFAVYDLSALGFKTLLLVCSPVWILTFPVYGNAMLSYEQQTFTTLFCTILARPVTPSLNSRTNRNVRVRDMRESAWRPFGRWMLEKDWALVLEAASCKEKSQPFSSELKGAIELSLPWRTVKINNSDRPWIAKRLKSSIKKRQEAFIKVARLNFFGGIPPKFEH